MWTGVEKVSHLSDRKETKWSKTNLFAYLCCYKSLIRVTMAGNNDVYKTMLKNGNKEYNEKYIHAAFLRFEISAIPYINLFYYQQTHTVIFIFFSCAMHCISNVYFTLYVPCFPFFLIDHNQKQVLLVKWVIFFLKLKNIFLLFLTFGRWLYSQCCFDVDQRCETRRWK